MTAYTPNLPALMTALPGDATRAPQTEFTRARQVLFLENLSVTGSVRSAASAAQVSHQTAYRARRATAAFRTAWDAALVVARVSVADTVGCRAIDGITEPVFYHGEEVGSRTRFSDRLLLAHLARLDRHAADERINAIAEDFEGALGRFEAGEEVEPLTSVRAEPVEARGHSASALRQAQGERVLCKECGAENFPLGPCNTRSMSYTPDEDDNDWEDEEAAEAELDRILAAMEADRPADAPPLTGTGPDGEDRDPGGLVEDAQFSAFQAGVPRWWLVVPPVPPGRPYVRPDAASAPAPSSPERRWHYADDPAEGGDGYSREAGGAAEAARRAPAQGSAVRSTVTAPS